MTTLVWAGIALPEASGSIQTNFGVCVEGNRILASGTRADLRRRYPDAEEAGGAHFMLLPGMVNSHDHGRAIGSATLGVPDDLLEIWLPGLATQPQIDPYLAAAYDGLQLLHSGVTLTAHSHNPRDWRAMPEESVASLRGYRDAGIRVAFHPPLIDQNSLIYDGADAFLAGLPSTVQDIARPFLQLPPVEHDAYFDLCAQLYAGFHDPAQHTTHIQVSPAGGQWCSDELIRAAVDFARQHNTRVQMHMLETRYQQHYAYRRWGQSFIRHLDAIGALGPWLTLAHMVWVDQADVPLLAERGVGVAHNPSSNLRLRSGIAPVPALWQAGVRLGVGLDGHALDDDQDYLRELRLAWTLSNRPGAGAPTVPAPAFWHMGTRGGAAITLGAEAPLGGLTPGALADLVLLDQRALLGAWAPDDYLSRVAAADVVLRRANRQHVRHVMVNGRWVVWDGRAQTLDEEAIATAIRSELARQGDAAEHPAAQAVRALAPYLRAFYATWDD